MVNSFNLSLKIGSPNPMSSLIPTKGFDLLARLGVCKPRISGPLSCPLITNVKENNAGKGDYGKCERFYSSQYHGDHDEKKFGIRMGRIFVTKTFKRYSTIPGEKHEYEKPDLLEKLKHPNTVKYVHIDAKNRTVTMKDAGFSLTEIRKTVRLSFYEDLYIYLKVLDWVQHAHGRGICHKDTHEGNITLQKDGTVKIIDFGLAEDVSNISDNNDIKFGRDIYWLSENLRSLLERHIKSAKSGNPNEKKHYKLIKQIAPRGKELLPYSDLMRLKTELEKMSEFFPEWGHQDPPPETKCDDVTKLQESSGTLP
ncbi:MAG: hypothetical protein C5B47_03700 [Verrucomicrobia bacterium]|nr:MAG: hypothetical protein C5B47_03700 [Verrucomicrobiota bacterium]